MIALTLEERERCAAWCEQSAASLHGVVDQMATMPGDSVGAFVKQRRVEVMALEIVSRLLRSLEPG